ncbi:MAG TPA: dephospho-CoA kinase [Thermovirgaceae bacterium]|jgi:dephospho-CoA kinase|nr:dephospho-CoA kinase [Thermovirgaceae bacterium]
MLVVGLTGDVGAGKSTVSSIWASAGARVLSADAIVAKLWRTEELVLAAVDRWGESILDPSGYPDHAAISALVFDNDNEYRWICDTVHPLARREMYRWVKELDGWVVAEIPLLFENGVPEWIDLTVYVEAPEICRISRNAARGWDAREIHRRQKRLMPTETKRDKADFVLLNDGGLQDLSERAMILAKGFIDASSLTGFFVRSQDGEISPCLKDALSGYSEVVGMEPCPDKKAINVWARPGYIEKIRDILGECCPEDVFTMETGDATLSVPKRILLRVAGGETDEDYNYTHRG